MQHAMWSWTLLNDSCSGDLDRWSPGEINISLVHFCDSACNMVLDIVDSCSGDLDKGPLLDQGGLAKSI